jgi:hypothetical protein
VLNRSRDSGHPCLVPDFGGNGSTFSPLSMMLDVGLSYIAFYSLLSKRFYHEVVVDHAEDFFCIY